MKGSHQSESHWQSIMARPDPTQVEVDKITETNDTLRMQNIALLNNNSNLMKQNAILMNAVTNAVVMLTKGEGGKALKHLVDEGLDATDIKLGTIPMVSETDILRKNPRND